MYLQNRLPNYKLSGGCKLLLIRFQTVITSPRNFRKKWAHADFLGVNKISKQTKKFKFVARGI